MSQIATRWIAAALLSGLTLGFVGALVLSHTTRTPESTPAPVPQTYLGREPILIHADAAPPPPVPIPEVSPAEPQLSVAVSVCGAVNSPDVYRFEEGRRVHHALQAAGGVTAEASMEDINLAARLMDNTTLYIPYKVYTQQDGATLVARRTATAAEMNPARYTRSGWNAPATTRAAGPVTETAASSPAAPTAVAPSASGLINLNQASLLELQQLPGIGPVTAEKILTYRSDRPFSSIEELREVHGIGDKKLDAVRHLVTVE